MTELTFSVSIGGLGVSIVCPFEEFTSRLAVRYRHFSPATKIHVSSHVRLDNDLCDTEVISQQITFKDEALLINTGRMKGIVNIEIGQGEIYLPQELPVEEFEYYLRAVYSILGFWHGGVLLHSAGVVRRGKAYLFFGHSGSGKTTITNYSKGDGLLSDDLVLVLPDNGQWIAHATPFWNPGWGEVKPVSAPVHSLFRLVQNESVFVQAMGRSEAIAELIASVPVIPVNDKLAESLIVRCLRLINDVRVVRLHFREDPSFWEVIEGIKT